MKSFNFKLKRKAKNTKKPAGNKNGWKTLLIIFVIIGVVLSLVGFITDCMWFADLGYSSVFWKKYITEFEIGTLIFIISVLLTRLYLKSLKKGYFSQIESKEIPNLKRLNIISWILAGAFGIMVAVPMTKSIWLEWLKFFNAEKFNLKDPVFHLDIGFYVFKLDFLEALNSIVIGIVIGLVIVTLIYYVILLMVRTPDFIEDSEPDFNDGQNYTADDVRKDFDNTIPFREGKAGKASDIIRDFVRKDRTNKTHLNRNNISHLFNIASLKITILGIIAYLMLCLHFVLEQFNLLHAHTGTVYGAGFTDVNITLNIYRIIMLLSLIGIITFGIHMRKREYKKLLKVPAIILGVLVLGFGVQLAVQGLIVSPDEINKESKYLSNNIEFTRHAYGLDSIDVKPFKAESGLDAEVIRNNNPTIGNIRINDYEPVKDFYNQTQSIRQYYDFNDVDIDRYMINGALTQTYLAAREINEGKISKTWINKHLKYTHGYGFTLSQVDAVTSSGQPDVLVKNIPSVSSVNEINIDRPEIYFGESTDNYVVVNTDEQEFDYPDGNDNKYTKYEAKSGIKMNLLNRILFSIRERSPQLLVSSNVNSDSRIIINRNVEKRVKRIMPYLKYEKDPYMVTVDGKLYWIIDAYTTSSNYPYSEPYSGDINTANYIRNSIKVVIDAYTGDLTYYIVDNNDPIAKTYMKVYPKLFKDIEKMPEGIKSHLRYPNSLFEVQAEVYTKYHMQETKVFYQKEDLWDISKQIYGTSEKKMEPSYYIFRLPGEKEAEFINMVPFTPKSKQNMTAIMMARNDGDNYGKLMVYKLPKNKTVYGPMQIEAQIDQNTEISKEFSLWNSSGSKYRRGDMFVIPIEESLMYVEPVYLEASNQAIPEVKRVIVAYGDRIAYQPTLAAALEELFGEDASAGASGSGKEMSGEKGSKGESSSVKDLAIKASEAYEKAVSAQRQGDWKLYGEYLKELQKYLDQLKDATE